MKALRITAGDATRLDLADLPIPNPKAGEALVRVRAAGLNRADLLQRRGLYPPPPGAPVDIPGLEYAGVIETTASDVRRFAAGQRVFGLCSGGAQAEYIAISAGLLMQSPASLSDIQAGGIPEAYITAQDALVRQAGLQPAERVLIHAVGSGVGLAALQIAKAWGCEVFGTSRSPEKLARAHSMGVTYACTPESFDEEILKVTNGRGVDVILDPVGAAYFERNLRVLAECGRLIVIATMSGTTIQLQLPIIMRKRLRLIGTVLRSRSLEQKIAATQSFEHDLLPKFASGELNVVIDRVYPIEQAAQAYDYMEANKNFGKMIFTI